MLRFYLTIDTELSADHFRRHGRLGMEDGFARAIMGRTATGDLGIVHQMAVLDDHGLKGVFFVDPMPALVCGIDVIKRIVDPILTRGHDVQLHAHSEWLAFTDPVHSPTGGRTGRNMRDFSLVDQCAILAFGSETLVKAGAQTPIAFRAGNYGANDDTLRALAVLGIRYDSSFPPGITRSDCRINLPRETVAPVRRLGVIEVPIAAIGAAGGGAATRTGDGDLRLGITGRSGPWRITGPVGPDAGVAQFRIAVSAEIAGKPCRSSAIRADVCDRRGTCWRGVRHLCQPSARRSIGRSWARRRGAARSASDHVPAGRTVCDQSALW